MSFGDPVRLGIGELFLELFFDALVFERPRREGRLRTILSQTAVTTAYRGENTSSVEKPVFSYSFPIRWGVEKRAADGDSAVYRNAVAKKENATGTLL